MSHLIDEALSKAAARFRVFKRAAQQSQEVGWTLQPEELWEQADDDALATLERAQAERAGATPLFEEAV